MKICHIIPNANISAYYDTSFLYHEESCLSNKVDIITNNKKYDIIDINNNLRVHVLPSIKLLNQRLDLIINMNDYIKKIGPDIIHSHIIYKIPTLQGIQISSSQKIPNLVSIHGAIAPLGETYEWVQKGYNLSLGNHFLKKTNLVRCLNSNDAKIMMKFGVPNNKIRVIPNGVDTEQFSPDKEKDYSQIFWCGRFVRGKGIEKIIHSAKTLELKNIDFRFYLAGTGPLETLIKQRINKLNLNNKVKLLGKVDHKKISQYMKKSGIFIYPSEREGMPYAVLEAMASGCAVLGSDISGLRELITNYYDGILIDANENNLSDNMAYLLQNTRLQKKLGYKARKTIETKYSWKKIAKIFVGLYKELIESRLN